MANIADISARAGSRGWTPLHAAVQKGRKKAVELIIAKGTDITATDNKGQTPLQLAKEKGDTEIVGLLRKHGAKE